MIKDQLIINFFKRTKLSHTVILSIALCFWFASMFFTTITVVHVNEFSSGWMTLLSGWLAVIFHANPAWLANIFLFYIVTCYENVQKTLITPTIFAVLLSACTFFLHNIMISEMPAFAPIFGYGWGAILWFTSIYLIVIAVGLRLIKIASNGEDSTLQYDRKTQGIQLLKLGIFLFISHTLLITTKGFWDQTMASTWEKNRLSESNTIYKRGWVCRKEIRAKEIMKNFTGILKVNLNPPNNIQPSHAYTSLDNPRFYLDEGIPKVQLGDLEYQYHNSILKTQPKKSIPSAELIVNPLKIIKKVSDKMQPNKQFYEAQLSLTLQDLLTTSLLFQETWEGNVSDDYINNFDLKKDYYFSLHECSQPDPKRLLINALNISQQPLNAPSKEYFKFKVLSLIPAEEVELKYREQIKDTDSLKDINCPKEVGLDYPDPYMSEKWLGRVGPYDAIGTLKNYDKYYVFHYRKNHPTQLFCTKNNLYLYSYLYSNASIRISATNEDNDLPFSKEIILERYYSDAGKFEAKNALLVNLEEKKDSIQMLFYDKEKDHWINYQFTKEPVDQ